MSQETLALAAEINLKHYGEIERGRRPGVKLDTLLRITDALGVSLRQVVDGAYPDA